MKMKILYLLLLCVIAGIGIMIKLYVYDRQTALEGNLQIVSVPESSVFVNAEAMGRTPFNHALKPGMYDVKLIPLATDQIASVSAMSWQGKVEITSRQYTFVRRELNNTEIESAGEILTLRTSDLPPAEGTGDIEIFTEPAGAIVSLDGEDVGVSPHIIRGVTIGGHEISLYQPKFKRRTIQIKVESGGYTTVLRTALGLDVDFDKKYELARLLEASGSARLPSVAPISPTPTGPPKPTKVKVLDTPTGYLRVRAQPSLAGDELTRVKPGESYPYLDEQQSWVKIKLTDKEGWVSGEYVKKE
jgi:hypothetical protein